MQGSSRLAVAAAAAAPRIVTDLSDTQPLVVGRARGGEDGNFDHFLGLQQRKIGDGYLPDGWTSNTRR